jgi:hypothetical protein
MAAEGQVCRGMAAAGEYAGGVIGHQELAALLAPFGMIVQVDPDEDMAFQTAQMANALVGAVEAHASRAEDAYRQQGAGPAELVQTGLMAFAGVPCQGPADELALIQWRAQHLAGALNSLDFPGPIPRRGDIGSGDALIRTMRLAAAALSAMAKAAHIAAGPASGPGAAREAGMLLSRAMDALAEAAKDVHRHRAAGDLMSMT